MDYNQVHEFISKYNLGPGNPSDYDFNGVVHLMIAALENLQKNATEGEINDIGHSFTDEQRYFLKKIADYACSITDEEINND